VRTFGRPRVVVSSCLGFEACRYNGVGLPDALVKRLEPFVDFVPVCPEVEIGLGIPRPTLRVLETGGGLRLVQPATARDLTEEMVAFGRAFLQRVGPVDGFLLKSRSPSCGLHDVKVYAGAASPAPLRRASGFFAREVREAFPTKAAEDEGRGKNFAIREHFLTGLFASADLRGLVAKPSLDALVRFHSTYKLVLMAYSQKGMRLLGRIVAHTDGRPAAALVEEYALHFHEALQRAPRCTSHVNVLQHAFGYFKEELSPREKQHFLRTLDKYRDAKVPLSVPLALVRAWVERFETAYLADQVYFEPYPDALLEITDSGKGRDL